MLQPNSPELWALSALTAAVTAYLFFYCFRSLLRFNLMRDIPTSRIRSAAQGYVELEGTGRLLDGPAIISPLSGSHCLWWRYSVHRRTSQGKRSQWTAVSSGTSDSLFCLDDRTGRCIVDPDGAEVIPSRSFTWYGNTEHPDRGPAAGSVIGSGNYRYREDLLYAGGPLYAVGGFRTQRNDATADLETAVRDLLTEWKSDQPTLLKRFDVNRDGQISSREWEAARRVAHMQAEIEHRNNPPESLPGLHVLAHSQGRPFLLSGVAQEQLTRKFIGRAVLSFFGFLFAGSFFLWLVTARHVL